MYFLIIQEITAFLFLLQDTEMVVGNAKLEWSQARVCMSTCWNAHHLAANYPFVAGMLSLIHGPFFSIVNEENVRLLSPAVGLQSLSNSLPMLGGQMPLSLERLNFAFLSNTYFWDKGISTYLSLSVVIMKALSIYNAFLFFFFLHELGKGANPTGMISFDPKGDYAEVLDTRGKKTMKTGTDPADIDMSNLAHSFFLRS